MPDYIPQPMMDPMYGMGMGPTLIKQQGDFDKWRLDTKNIADQLEHQLCGEVWDQASKSFIPGGFSPSMNRRGAAEISNMIRDLNNRVSFLSELNEDQIKEICYDVNSSIIETIVMNWNEWEVRKESAGWVVTKVMNMIFIGLNRAKGRGEAELMSQMTHINRQVIEGQQQQHGSFLGAFFGRNKNRNNQGGY